jgi:hypothetical protein
LGGILRRIFAYVDVDVGQTCHESGQAFVSHTITTHAITTHTITTHTITTHTITTHATSTG